jgi:uncharacterized membrane protein YvbJ
VILIVVFEKHPLHFFNLLKNKPNKKWLLSISIIIIIITGIVGYLIGDSFSKDEDKFLLKLQNILDSKDPYKAMNYITFENNEIKITKENLSPFFQYIKSNSSRSREFLESLRITDTKNSTALLKKEDKWYGSVYKLELRPVYMDVSLQYKDTEIIINNNLYSTTKKDNETMQIGPLVPGIYTVKAILKNSYGETSQERDLLALNKNNNLSFNINAIKLTIDSNFEDASVYLNGAASEKQVKDFKDVGPIPVDNSIIAYAEKTFPWGTVKSSEVEVNNTSKIRLEINPLTDSLKQKLQVIYSDFYDSLFSALTEETKELITNCTDAVRDYIYSKLKKDTIIIKNSYSITDMDFEQDIISLDSNNDNFSASANITVSYKEQKRLFIIDLPSYNSVTKKFKTILTYDSKYDNWTVSKIEEMSASQ